MDSDAKYRILIALCGFEVTPGSSRVHNLMNGLYPSIKDTSHKCGNKLDSKGKKMSIAICNMSAVKGTGKERLEGF